MSTQREFAINLVKELKSFNKQSIIELTKNNDLINSIIEIYELDEEEVSNGEFTNTLSKSPNKVYGYTYHDYDEDSCDKHYCEDCEYGNLTSDDEPCSDCNNAGDSDNCYFTPKQDSHDPRPIKSYDDCYNPISHSYLECHNSNDCIHSVSTCKYCKYRATKSDEVPCVGCNCIHPDRPICFHVDDEN